MKVKSIYIASFASLMASDASIQCAAFSTASRRWHLGATPTCHQQRQSTYPCRSRCFSTKAKKVAKDDGADVDTAIFEEATAEASSLLPFASTYHAPVMWQECIDGLLGCERSQARTQSQSSTNDKDGKNRLIFVDGTLGGGGHSEALLQALRPGDVLFGCDVDPNALATASQRLEQYMTVSTDKPLFVPVQSNFAQLTTILPRMTFPDSDEYILKGINNHESSETSSTSFNCIDGVLLDLGVSSHQIDTAERGFSFMREGALDMRMMAHADSDSSLTAADLCNEMDEAELAQMFQQYGDEPRNRAKSIAKSIVLHRPLTTTQQLQEAVAAVVPAFHKQSKRKGLTATLARVFQSLRIVVNQEDRVLKQVLEDVCPSLLRQGGRLVVLSYHSMEDRATKRVMRDGTIAKQRGSPEKDIYGNYAGPPKPFRPIGKFRKASEQEIAKNSRARSATLRIAERLQIVPGDEQDYR